MHLEKEMATHSSVLAWRIPGMGEPAGLPSLGLHRVGHDWSYLAKLHLLCENTFPPPFQGVFTSHGGLWGHIHTSGPSQSFSAVLVEEPHSPQHTTCVSLKVPAVLVTLDPQSLHWTPYSSWLFVPWTETESDKYRCCVSMCLGECGAGKRDWPKPSVSSFVE